MVSNIKTIEIGLSSKDLKELKKKIQNFKTGLEKASEDTIKEMANYVETQVRDNLANTPYKDGNEDATAYSEIHKKVAKAGMMGSQVAYDEFGTGTKGEESPYPDKDSFGLNGYNSGKHIKVSKEGELFWIYRNQNGDFVKTQGIPAGKQVFNASVMLKGQKGTIIKEKVGEALSKL